MTERDPAAGGDVADAVFLIHGLGGTQYDLGSMHKRLKNAGFVTHTLTLPGHGTDPRDLIGVTVDDWVGAVRAKYVEVAQQHPRFHLMGMCMGSLLAALLASEQRHACGNLVVLAPPIYIDGWATPWYRGLRRLLYSIPAIARSMKIEEEDPYGIKNEQLRAIVKAKFERGENFHYGWVPLECIRQVDRLRARVMAAAPAIRCPTLVVHAREDELTSLRSANFLVEAIGGARARMVVLEDSYHMVCVDNDREIVAKNVLEFFGATVSAGASALANDPKMSRAALDAAVEAVAAALGSGDFGRLRELAIPDLVWVQPGTNRLAGTLEGKALGGFAERWANAGALRFAAFGNPAYSRGIALVPATLEGGRDGAVLASQGALLLAFHAGRLLEVRWFADDIDGEDAFFGPPEPADTSARALETAFEAATLAAKKLAKAPDNDALLGLYSLYKQSTSGDVTGERPGALDMVNRAKYDAWAARRGMTRTDAMQAYVALVDELGAAT